MIYILMSFLKNVSRGAWVAQSVKYPTLGFGSGHDLTVREFQPRVGHYADSAEPAWDFSLPLSLPLPSLVSLSLSPSQNKQTFKNVHIKSLA